MFFMSNVKIEKNRIFICILGDRWMNSSGWISVSSPVLDMYKCLADRLLHG